MMCLKSCVVIQSFFDLTMITIFYDGGDQITLNGAPKQAEETSLSPGFRVVDRGTNGALICTSVEGGGFSFFLQEEAIDTVDREAGIRVFGKIWPEDVDSVIFSRSVVE